MIALRPMRIDDVRLVLGWDADPDVAAALGGPAAEWYDWPAELTRDVAWRELLIAEEVAGQDRRAIGFVQLLDAAEEESHYWGGVEAGTWAIDIWLGSPADRGRGLGSRVMRAAIARAFDQHRAHTILIDPIATNVRAIAFYERLGFERIGPRELDGELCLVMRLRHRDRR